MKKAKSREIQTKCARTTGRMKSGGRGSNLKAPRRCDHGDNIWNPIKVKAICWPQKNCNKAIAREREKDWKRDLAKLCSAIGRWEGLKCLRLIRHLTGLITAPGCSQQRPNGERIVALSHCLNEPCIVIGNMQQQWRRTLTDDGGPMSMMGWSSDAISQCQWACQTMRELWQSQTNFLPTYRRVYASRGVLNVYLNCGLIANVLRAALSAPASTSMHIKIANDMLQECRWRGSRDGGYSVVLGGSFSGTHADKGRIST